MRIKHISLLLLVPWCHVLQGLAATVSSPFLGGGTGLVFPFFADTSYSSSFRFQQVYAGSDFTSIGSPMLVTELEFLPWDIGAHSAVIPNIQINFSTTAVGPDGLSSTFADNVGANNTIVHSGSLSLFLTTGGRIHLPLQQPFLFNPASGNLLMDVRNFQPAAPIFEPRGYMEGASRQGDTVSIALAYSANSLTSDFRDTIGLVTIFHVTPIPEPRIGVLSLVALLLVACSARMRFRSTCSPKCMAGNRAGEKSTTV